MAAKKTFSTGQVNRLLKSLLLMTRTVQEILETRAVETSASMPLSASKVQVLRLLDRRSGQTSSQVARFLCVTRPAVSQIIDAMVRSKLVTRRPDGVDRREIRLGLTKRGKDTIRAIRREQQHLVRLALRSAECTKVDAWTEVLERITGATIAAGKTLQDFCLQCGAHDDDTCILVGGDHQCPYHDHQQPSSKRPRRKTAKRR